MSPPPSRERRPRLWLAASNAAPAAPPRPVPSPHDKRAELPLDDVQLLEALRAADAGAAAALHDRVRPQIDRTIARLLGRDDQDADDVAQLALIELVTTIDRFRGDCSLDAWTSLIAARAVYKHIRRRRTERRIFAGADMDELSAHSTRGTPRDLRARALLARVRGHLDALDEQKAWTFLLHDVGGYDLREIAEITGASVAAAQTRLSRGRRELHERIAADPELREWLETMGDET